MSRSVAFVVVAAALFSLLMGSNTPTPLYDVYRREWHLSPFVMTAVFSIYPLTQVGVLWGGARISDRFGRRPILLAALAACALGSIFFALANAPFWLFAGRVAQALAVGLASGAAGAALVELEPRGNRRRAALAMTLMFAAGGAFGPLLAGLLAQYAPHPLLLPYVVHLGVLVPLAVLAFYIPETAPRVEGSAWHPRLPVLPPETRVPFAIVSIAAGVAWMVVSLYFSVVPSYLRVELGSRSLGLAGIAPFAILALSTATQLVVRAADRVLLYVSYLLLAGGMLAVVLAVPFHAVWLVVFGAIVAGIGHGCGVLGSQSAITRIAPPATRGETISLFYAVNFLMVGTSILSLGAIASAHGFFAAFVAFGLLIAAICGGLAWALALERSL